MRTGRPFRFLGVVFGCWAGMRVFVLSAPEQGGIAGPLVTSGRAASEPEVIVPVALPTARPSTALTPSMAIWAAPRAFSGPIAGKRTHDLAAAPPPAPGVAAEPVEIAPAGQVSAGALPPPLRVEQPSSSRWSGSAWAIARPSGSAGGLGSSQLGGSQAGARLAYALGSARRLALVGRVATPLEGRGREAALGVEWRVPRTTVRVFAERRFALDDGARGGPSAGVIGGADERLGGLRLEAYGQAGAIKRDRVEGFADGAARLTRKMGGIGPAGLDFGAGAWGAAQRDAERLDVGPTVGVSVPVGGRAVRLTLDYRARVAGRARPGSGPALSLGADF